MPDTLEALLFSSPPAGRKPYAVLNGYYVYLVVSPMGDFGVWDSSGSKQGGSSANPPCFQSDGSLDFSASESYGIGFLGADTSLQPSLEESLEAKKEYLTVGTSTTTEQYAIQVDGGSWKRKSGLLADVSSAVFSVSENALSGELTAHSSYVHKDHANLTIAHAISFNDAGSYQIVKVAVTISNSTGGTRTIRYARACNPQPGVPYGGSITTSQTLLTPLHAGAFAVTATGGTGARKLGLGVLPADANAVGVLLASVPGSTESQYLTDPLDLVTNDVNAFRLDSSGRAATFLDIDNLGDDNGATADYTTGPWLRDSDSSSFAPVFSTGEGLLLISPELSVADGSSQVFTFYYFIGEAVELDCGEEAPVPCAPKTLRTLHSGLEAALQQQTLRLALLCKLTRTDGTVLGFSTHDKDLTVDGVTYAAANAIEVSALRQEAGGGVDNLEARGMLSSDQITEADLRAGRYDGATLAFYLAHWADLSQTPATLAQGTIGDITLNDGEFKVEFVSQSQRFAQQIGRLVGPTCDAAFGDSRCGFNIAARTHSRTVATVTDARRITFGSDGAATGYYDYGRARGASGLNNGITRPIKSHTLSSGQAQIVLQEAFPFPVAPGDAFTLIGGCVKTAAACTANGNILNFRGFPHIPGTDQILKRGRPDAP